MANFNLRRLSAANRKLKKQASGSEQIRELLSEVLSFTNTSQVDFDKFTPEILVDVAKYEIENADKIHVASSQSINFISKVEDKPHVKRSYACCL